ncbi:MAG: IPT/TIG domain-containing protein, partial [Niabella sp.]|nr:IPT/TIG domain-containing protein [Niabella sp.]
MKKNIIIAIIAFCSFFCSCSKQTDADTEVHIQSISKNVLRGGDAVTIKGKNLANSGDVVKVLLNGIESVITAQRPDSINVIVPKMAGSGAVQLIKKGTTYTGPTYTYHFQATASTIAGTGQVGSASGDARSASFYCPWGIVANSNDELFIADCYNRLIRKISLKNQMVDTYSLPTLINGKSFYSPYNIALDESTGNLYVTDFNTNLLRIQKSGSMDVIYT